MDPGDFIVSCSSFEETNKNLKNIPINALSLKTRSILSDGLNQKKIIPSDSGDQRDWRGIIKNFGYPNFCPNDLMNAMEEVLNCLCSNHLATLGRFQEILERIDRWDVYADTLDHFHEDARNYSSQSCEIPRSIGNKILVPYSNIEPAKDDKQSEEKPDEVEPLTFEDVERLKMGCRLERYSAFILCSDDSKDVDFANKIKVNLQNVGRRVIDKNDLLIGSFETEATMQVIATRCDHLIVVISENFLKHAAAKFYLKFGQWEGIEKDERKVIPCKYENIKSPYNLAFCVVLYHNSNLSYDQQFWRKLELSLLIDKKQRPMITASSPVSALPAPTPTPPVQMPRLAIEPPILEYPTQSNIQTSSPNVEAIVYKPSVTLIKSFISSESAPQLNHLTSEQVSNANLSPKPSQSIDCLPSTSSRNPSNPMNTETKQRENYLKLSGIFVTIKKAMTKSKSKKEKSKKN